jgi:lysophospholipase L1-like esterase
MMNSKGIKYLDFTEEFMNEILIDENPETFFAPDYHFSSKGNQYIAKYIYQYLKKNNYLDKKGQTAGTP